MGDRGFTLVEMIVAVALFAVVMLVSVGALLSLVGANRKAQTLQSVMNNLNVAMDGMVRSLRMGSSYHCGPGSLETPQDCDGEDAIAFQPFCSESCDPSVRWVYAYDKDGTLCGEKRICKSEDNGFRVFPVTAPEVEIERFDFYVIGTARGDEIQPKVVISVKGTAGAENLKTRTSFNIQATAVQRLLDL